MSDNMTKLAPGMYLVRTQAGFRRAIKDEFSDIYGDWQWMASRLRGYPTSYPSLVSLSIGYNGDTVFQCNSVHLSVIKSEGRDKKAPWFRFGIGTGILAFLAAACLLSWSVSWIVLELVKRMGAQ